jgi:hypothetical protein
MAGTNLTIEGLREALRVIRDLPDGALKAAARGLFVEGERVMTLSKRDFVPVDLGTLRASGHVQPPAVQGSRVSVTLGYGGAASAYAVVQHERLDFNHPRGGQAKYLEAPVMQEANRINRNVSDAIGDAIGRGR